MPVTYQLYDSYYSKYWSKLSKKQSIVSQQITSKVEVKKDIQIQQQRQEDPQQIEQNTGSAKKGLVHDDTVCVLYGDLDKLNITNKLYQHSKQGSGNHINKINMIQQIPNISNIYPAKQQEIYHESRIRTAANNLQQSKSKSKSSYEENKYEKEPQKLKGLSKHNSNKQLIQPRSSPKAQNKAAEQRLVAIDQTRTQPPPKQQSKLSPFSAPKSQNEYPQNKNKAQSIASKSDIDDLKSKYQASQKMALQMKNENEKLKLQIRQMKKVQEQMMAMFKLSMKKQSQS